MQGLGFTPAWPKGKYLSWVWWHTVIIPTLEGHSRRTVLKASLGKTLSVRMTWGRGGECAWTVWGQKGPTGSSLPPRSWGGNKHSPWHFDLRIIRKQISAFLNHVSCGNWKIIQTSFFFQKYVSWDNNEMWGVGVKRRSAGPGPDRSKTKNSRGARDTSRCHRTVSSQWIGEELAPNWPL